MKCSECGLEIELKPSANDEAGKLGQSASYYTKIFTMHTSCQLKKRNNNPTTQNKRDE
tara:strand:- start:865 stop:1038 length:174 start_codon:yes stop_codon:yes gene_type:complete